MIKKNITPKQMVDFLNSLLKIDKRAIENLFNIRIFCNKKLALHPTVQVGKRGKNTYSVGMIGILNGLFGIDKDKWGCLCMDINNGRIKQFRIVREKDKKKL